jgi:hypothetical protein
MAGSGYQQDSNQITPGLYRVVINTQTNFATTGTAGGGINPYDWTTSTYTNATSMTAAQALLLAQGNVRWNLIVQELVGIADCRILDVVVTGATNGTDATAQNTQIAFTVEFYRDQYILGEWNKWLASQGATANGTYTNGDGSTGTAYNSLNASGTTAITSTQLAIQDLIAQAIVTGGSTGTYYRTYRVWNPTQSGDSQVKVTLSQPCTPAQAFSAITLPVQISGTTLAGTPL